tara:strand:- start:480 stop:1430 length:951 start_codon:yes stop_codon:yes gene_type:complete
MKLTLLTICIIFFTQLVRAQNHNSWEHEKLWIADNNNSNLILESEQMYTERWNILPQALFWKRIMKLSSDSCLVNVASTRQILQSIDSKEWYALNKTQKLHFREEMRIKYNIEIGESIYVTSGKSDFYKFEEVYPTLREGITVFDEMCVDPWYAQSVLLIESPGQLKKSVSGAYGAFQLMPSVARAQGLIVNKTKDERKDFEKSATAAAKLIKNICIPEAKKILKAHELQYSENDLWFRFLVLHIYHAGAGNVAAVLKVINPEEGSQELIKSMWQNKAAGFGNCSQNYSQLAIASQLILHEMVYSNCEDVISYSSR